MVRSKNLKVASNTKVNSEELTERQNYEIIKNNQVLRSRAEFYRQKCTKMAIQCSQLEMWNRNLQQQIKHLHSIIALKSNENLFFNDSFQRYDSGVVLDSNTASEAIASSSGDTSSTISIFKELPHKTNSINMTCGLATIEEETDTGITSMNSSESYTMVKTSSSITIRKPRDKEIKDDDDEDNFFKSNTAATSTPFKSKPKKNKSSRMYKNNELPENSIRLRTRDKQINYCELCE